MQINNKQIKKQFEKSMQNYDKNAVVQKIIASKMLTELSKIKNHYDTILELGSGTGILTAQIAHNLNFKTYYANDLIEKSKFYVQKSIPQAQFLCGNALKIKTAKQADLIISNAMFQWFENLDKVLQILTPQLNNHGILAFSTFTKGNYKEIKELTGLTLQYKSTDEIENTLKNNGFEILYIENFTEELNFNTPLELLAHMKNTGVNSLSENTWSIKDVKAFCDKYSKIYPSVCLTYEPLIVIAEKI
ncbi:MAG: malonyl-ACP O-methyltransferase BioC [Candidatus Gastranaerophilaceae bacterium]